MRDSAGLENIDLKVTEMDKEKYINANREAWNEATLKHQEARGDKLKNAFASEGYSTLDEFITAKMKQYHIEGKDVAQLCCNNGRELLSMLNLGAKSGVGFDISDEAINEAGELAEISGLAAKFVRTDVLEIGHEYDDLFDMIYISIGALTWLPDLRLFFKIVWRLLRNNGVLIIYEQHPFTNMLAASDEKEYDASHPLEVVFSYFRTEPWEENSGIDYIGKTTYEAKTAYSFTQKISDILNPMIQSGIGLVELIEYDHDISLMWECLEKEKMVPLSYILVGQKNG